MIRYLLPLLIIFSLSCKSYLTKQYSKRFKFNREFTFKTKEEYVAFLKKTENFLPEKLLYFDRKSFRHFLSDTAHSQDIIYFGTFLNDSTCLQRSKILQDNPACYVSIIKEITESKPEGKPKKGIKGVKRTLKTAPCNLESYNIRYALNDSVFKVKQVKSKYTIILIYAHAMGKYYDRAYSEMLAFQKANKEEFDVYVVAIDMLQVQK